jgi:DNA-binding response OmpR family regulator
MSDDQRTDPPKILLADDDATVREPYARLLQRHGYECLCAPDAETALKKLQETEIDALIADIHMPGNAGLELIEKIPQIAHGLPVILLTGLPSVETAARSVQLSVAAYLVKPPKFDELLALLHDLIPRYRRLRVMSDSRQHLRQWSEALASLEESLRRHGSDNQNEITHDYLRLSLHNIVLQLADLDRSIAAWRQFDASPDFRRLDLVNALRHTIEVLEQTRQNFHSKALGELRKQLQSLLPPEGPK